MMDPQSEVLKAMKMERTKISYAIVYGLGLHFKKEVENEIKLSEVFSVSFDESLNKVSDMEQLDVVVKYWDVSKNRAMTRYFDSSFLGYTRASDLLEKLDKIVKPVGYQKLIQVAMDGPNVNLKLLKDLIKYLSELESDHPQVLDFGSCGLHNAFKVGINATGCKLIEFLRAIYIYFKDKPATKADYSYYTNSKTCKILCNAMVTQRDNLSLIHI